MNLLDDILTWLFTDTIGWLIAYLAPIAAVGIGIWLLLQGDIVAGLFWVLGGIVVGSFMYSAQKSRRPEDL